MTGRLTGAVALVMWWCIGCSVDDVPSASAIPIEEPISMQMLRLHPELKAQRFNDVLNFESPTDNVFVSEAGAGAQIDNSRAHTGHGSVRLAGASGKKINIKLTSLLNGKPFPGAWTLAGAYFLSDRPARVTLSCEVGGTMVARETATLSPGQWSPVLVDLATPYKPPKSEHDDAQLTIELDAPDAVWCDDVILIDNTRWILGGPDQRDDWTLCRIGTNYFCNSRGRFNLHLPSAEFSPTGWKIEEANALRVRFSSGESAKTITVYPDGRSSWDGRFRVLGSQIAGEPLWEQQQSSPAEIQVPQAMGRLNRNSIGDENNDGYNETRGAYSIIAIGPRLEVNIIPQSVPVLNPVLEITGLPAGNALVTIEGRLMERTVRLSDGTLLVELPIRLDRGGTVNIRVQ